MKKIYYIKCLVDEFHYEVQGYFETLEEAKEAQIKKYEYIK